MKNISFKIKMIFLGIAVVAMIFLLWFLSTSLTEKTQINSPLYNNIVVSEEIITDIAPPPAFAVESFVDMLGYIADDNEEIREYALSNIAVSKENFIDRQDDWKENLPE
jgi:methyl-accepting chemotaxis protein